MILKIVWHCSEDLLARSENGHGIKYGFPLYKPTPLFPKVMLPLLLRMVVRQVELELDFILVTYTYNFSVFVHQFVDQCSFRVRGSEPKQCHEVEHFAFW